MRFATLHPFAKLAVWMLLAAVPAAGIQGVAWLAGSDFNILTEGEGARGVLLFLAFASLMTVMAADRRPLSEYGLAVGPHWMKRWLFGLACGAAAFAVCSGVALAWGTLSWNTAEVSGPRIVKGWLNGMTAIPLSLTQQILFSGYLLSMLRSRVNRAFAVGISALLFAVLGRLDHPESLLAWQGQSLVIGFFLVAVLLGTLRLATGSIVLPAGVLAGWIFLERFASRVRLLAVEHSHPDLNAWMPYGDIRRSPAMWLLLAVAIGGAWWYLRKHGEAKIAEDGPALDAGFKRIFPLSHFANFTPLDVWIGRLVAARFRIGVVYVPRLAAALVLSTLNTILSLPERLILAVALRKRKVADPVFLLGVHRSGTTLLHNLMALDPQLRAPTALETLNPAGFVFSGWLLAPLLMLVMPWKRPMDNVRFHLFTPWEEEFALSASCGLSPHWGMSFPKSWPAYDRYAFPEQMSARERAIWQRHLLGFLRKLTLWTRRRPLLKNPYNTSRVALLHAMFPAARFVHIARHPYDVCRSNAHLEREAHVMSQLQDPDPRHSYSSRFLENYRAMETAYVEQIATVPAAQTVEIRFEDLERDPVGQLRQVYAHLGLEWTVRFEERLNAHLAGLSGYKKNRHITLPEAERIAIDTAMAPFMRRWNFPSAAATTAVAMAESTSRDSSCKAA